MTIPFRRINRCAVLGLLSVAHSAALPPSRVGQTSLAGPVAHGKHKVDEGRVRCGELVPALAVQSLGGYAGRSELFQRLGVDVTSGVATPVKRYRPSVPEIYERTDNVTSSSS